MNKFKCNHAVGFCKFGWLFYEDFTLYMYEDLYRLYNIHTSFDYCPICGKNLKKVNKDLSDRIYKFYERDSRERYINSFFKGSDK